MISASGIPLVSVVILNYNCKKFLGKCLSSVLNTDYPRYEIIFVDNNSNDGSVEFVTKEFHNTSIKVVKLSKNRGFSVGNNIGARYANGNYIAFLNPDTEVDPEWLKNLINVFKTNASIGIAQPKILKMDRKHFDSAGCFINSCGLVWNRGYGEEDKGQYDQLTEIFYAKGAALIIKRDLWNKLGSFDPIFFTYFEETDLCWRAWKSGYKVVYIPNAVVYHVGGGSLKDVPYHLKFHEARGRIALLIKHYPLVDILKYMPTLLLLYVFNVFRQLTMGKTVAAIAVIKGTVWCILNFKRIWISRKKCASSYAQTVLYNTIIKMFKKPVFV